MASVTSLSPLARSANAVVSYAGYLGKAFWPANLAVYYPHPKDQLLPGAVAGAGILLLGITLAPLLLRRKCPYLVMGWLWYLGMLLPVIGIVQVGKQALADRYTYLPMIGLCIAVVWGAGDTLHKCSSLPPCGMLGDGDLAGHPDGSGMAASWLLEEQRNALEAGPRHRL